MSAFYFFSLETNGDDSQDSGISNTELGELIYLILIDFFMIIISRDCDRSDGAVLPHCSRSFHRICSSVGLQMLILD